MRRLKPLETLNLGIYLVLVFGLNLILGVNLLVEPEHDVVNDVSHMFFCVLFENLILHQLLLDLLVELVETFLYACPFYIILAKGLV